MKNKISVIVPFFNAEKDIETCVNSIIRQKYDNFELILIDDGSTDNSLNIVKELKRIDKRIKVYTQKNGGVSSARNLGIKKSCGDYLMFVDSDDTVEDDIFIKMLDYFDEGIDLVICNYFENNVIKNKNSKDDLRVTNDFILKNIIYEGKFRGFVWNKLFKSSIVKNNGILFKEDVFICEDLLFCIEYCNKIKYGSYISYPLYNYNYSNNGLSGSSFNPKRFTIINSFDYIKSIPIVKTNKIVMKLLDYCLVKQLLIIWNLIRKSNLEFTEKIYYYDLVKKTIRNYSFDFLKSKYQLKYKLLFIYLKV